MNSHILSRKRRRYAVSCAAVLAVSMAGLGTSYALADETGEWTVTETPELDSSYWLNDIEPTNDGMIAVGETDSPSPDGVVAAQWDGDEWTDSQLPDATSLNDVSVTVSGDEAWAVGTGDAGGYTAHFDGTDWEGVDGPQPEAADDETSQLNGVSAAGSDIWAVGCVSSDEDSAHTPYAQVHDGEEWQLHEVPLPEGYDSACLESVEHDDKVYAVGTAYGDDREAPYVVSFDGEDFEEVEAPEIDGPLAGFTEVISLTVGYQEESAPIYVAGYLSHGVGENDIQPVLFEYEGEQWTQADSTEIPGRVNDIGRGLDGPVLTGTTPGGDPLLLSYQDGELQETDVPDEAASLSAVTSATGTDSPLWVVGSSETDDGGAQGLAAYQE